MGWTVVVIVVALALIAARVAWLWNDVSSQLHRVDALSGAADTPGETWLIVGSDARGGAVQDETEGARADSVMLLHKAENGQTSLTSLPRDTFVDIPEYGENKINAAYSFGGPKLLVQTVEKLSGLTVDHYVEVGMTGVSQMVDAVGGVNVCLDYDVADEDSGLVWDTSQGTCQTVDGTKALAYSRMRKSDPTGDVGSRSAPARRHLRSGLQGGSAVHRLLLLPAGRAGRRRHERAHGGSQRRHHEHRPDGPGLPLRLRRRPDRGPAH